MNSETWVLSNHLLLEQHIDENILALIAKKAVGNRPGRMEPRAVKRRPKPYKSLMKPRAIAKEEILKNGHPKKIK